jgi:DNA-directed RNA polymerase subunit RPC12/RpoP
MSIQILVCTMCGSDRLAIRQRTGFERVMVYLTQMRKYRCLLCRHTFRAEDRRRTLRDHDESYARARKT